MGGAGMTARDTKKRTDQKPIPDMLPPHNADAEEAVLGSILVDPSNVLTVGQILEPTDFYREKNAWVFESMLKLGDSCNHITLAHDLQTAGRLDTVGGQGYLSLLVERLPTSVFAEHYAKIVRDCSFYRQVITLSGKIAQMAYKAEAEPAAMFESMHDMVNELQPSHVTDIVGPQEHAERMFQMLTKRRDKTDEPVKFGWPSLDRFLGGLYPGDLVVIGARPYMGKCLAADTQVCDPGTGDLVPVSEYGGRTRCVTLNAEDWRLRPGSVQQVSDNGIRPCFQLETSTGRRVTATANHPLLSDAGWVRLESMQVGDWIAVPKSIPVFGTEGVGRARARLMGYLLAEGGLTQEVRFTNCDPAIRADFGACVAEAFPECELVMDGDMTLRVVKRSRLRGVPNPATEWLRRVGMMGKKSKDKVVPPLVFRMPKDDLKETLSTLFSCDGTRDRSGRRITLVMAAEKLVRQVQHLLLRFGILSQVHKRLVRCAGQPFEAWRLDITHGEAVGLFWDNIGFIGEKGTHQFRQNCRHGHDQDVIPQSIWRAIDVACSARGLSAHALEKRRIGTTSREGINAHRRTHNLTRKRLQAYAEILDSDVLRSYANSQVFWDKVASITPVGLKETYDLTVPGSHNFVANDVVVHNSEILFETALHNTIRKDPDDEAEVVKKVLVASAEMSVEEFDERESAMLGVPIEKLRSGQLEETQWDKLFNLVGELAKRPMYFLEGRMTIDHIYNRARLLQATEGLDLVIIDYIQLLRDTIVRRGDSATRERVSAISAGMKQLAQELKVPVITASQLNREVEFRKDKMPLLADLRESGSIEQDADVVIMVTRPEIYDPTDQPGVMLVNVAKARQVGRTKTISLVWRENEHQYGELDESHQEEFGGRW